MNRAERIYRLHAVFKLSRPISLQALIEKLEVSHATIKRDLAYMRDFMEAPIEYDRSANGYRYNPAADGFELPGLWFTMRPNSMPCWRRSNCWKRYNPVSSPPGSAR